MTDVAEAVGRMRVEQPDLVLLGEVLSIAAYVEPALLRRARLEFAPRAGAELEGRFWFSPFVESAGPDHLHLDPVFAEVLRGRLAEERHAVAARNLVLSAHEFADPAVVLFESVVWEGLSPDADPENVARPLLRLATTMAEDPERAADVARWVVRFVPRLPVALRETDCAVAVRLLAADKLGVHVVVPEVTAGVAGLMGGSAPSTSDTGERFGARLTSHGVVLSFPPEPGAEVVELSAPGRIVRVAAPGGGLAKHVQVIPGVPVEVGFGYLAVVVADGRVLRTVTLPGHITDLAADQELRTVAVGFADGEVRYGRWADDPAEWKRITREERGPVAVSPDGESIGMVMGRSVEVVSFGGERRSHPVGSKVSEFWLMDLVFGDARFSDPAQFAQRGERVVLTDGRDLVLRDERGERRWTAHNSLSGIRDVALMGQSDTPLAAIANTYGLVGFEPLDRMRLLPLDFVPKALVGLAVGTVLAAGSAGPVEVSGRAGSRSAVLVPQVVADRRAAVRTAAWYRTAVFYELLVATFKDSNGDGVGDLPGVAGQLDYLQWLGIDCVSLGPIQAEFDPRRVDERYGTVTDLVTLVDHAHRRGLRVVAELAVDRTAGVDRLLDTVWFWLDLGLDGVRITGDPGRFESRTVRRRAVGDHPDRVLIMEGRADIVEERGVLRLDTGLALQLFHAAARENRFLMPTPPVSGFFLRDREELSLDELLPDEQRFMLAKYAWTSSDSEGIRRRLAPLLHNDPKYIEMFLSLLFSLSGAPFLYYGDEIGMGGDVRRPVRDPLRTPMQWSNDRNAGFSEASPHRIPDLVEPDDITNVESQRSEGDSLLYRTRRLITVRKAHPALGAGKLVALPGANPSVLAYLRVDGEQVILCVANLSASMQVVELDLSAYAGRKVHNLLTDQDWHWADRTIWAFPLPGHGFLWAELVEGGDRT